LINGDILLITDSEFATVEQIPNGARGFDLRTNSEEPQMVQRVKASPVLDEGEQPRG